MAPVSREEDFAQMVAIPVPPMDPGRLRSLLFEGHRIEVPVTTHGARTFVRASFQAYNTEADAEALLGALRAVYGP
jgi:isopenicillin-N epimerase